MTFNMAICASAIAIGGLWGNNSAMEDSEAARSGGGCTSTCFLAVITQCHIVPVHARSYSINEKPAKSHQYSSWRTHQRNRRRRCLMKQRREKERPTEQEIGLGSQSEQLYLLERAERHIWIQVRFTA